MYITRGPRHPQCRISRLSSALGSPDSSPPRGGPPIGGRLSIAAPVLDPSPRERFGRFTGYAAPDRRRTEDRTLAGQPVSCSTVVPCHGTDGRAPSAGACWRRGGVCAALALLLATPESPSSRKVGRYARRAAVRNRGERAEGASGGSEASHRGNTEQLLDMRTRHDDEHQPHPCHRRRPHRDTRPGWDRVARVRGPCKGRARRRRLAGRNRGRRLDRLARGHPPPDRALRHVEHTMELAGDARIELRIRTLVD